MNAATEQHNWSAFLKFLSEQNLGRPTRISVFEGTPGAMRDDWLEDGLPLAGIDVDLHGENAPTVEIMLGDSAKTNSQHMAHVVSGARFAKITLSANGAADGLEIEDAQGKTTILRFEN